MALTRHYTALREALPDMTVTDTRFFFIEKEKKREYRKQQGWERVRTDEEMYEAALLPFFRILLLHLLLIEALAEFIKRQVKKGKFSLF